jgi:hypothetical protein
MKPLLILAAVLAITFNSAKAAEPLLEASSQRQLDSIRSEVQERGNFDFRHKAQNQAAFEAELHAHFAFIIERNFARSSQAELTALMNDLTEAEISDLAQLYVNSASTSNRAGRLLDIFALRLSERELARVARHFGFAQTYEKLVLLAPGKAQPFLQLADVNARGPFPGESAFGPARRHTPLAHSGGAATLTDVGGGAAMVPVAGASPHLITGLGQWLNHTPYEIYLSFRTAPIGALSVRGALWETTAILSRAFVPSFGTGYAVGTYIVLPLVQQYAPSIYNQIGASVGWIVDRLGPASGSGATYGIAQRDTAATFLIPSIQAIGLSGSGGDFGVSLEWSSLGNGGAGCSFQQCPPVPQLPSQ